MADHPPTYRVFVSSTFQDLNHVRPKVEAAVKRAGMALVAMEWFTADDRPTVQMCADRVKECDVFVCLVAHRFGWVPEGQPKGEEKSATWLEYEAARDKGLSSLVFEIDPDEKVKPSTAFDDEPGRAEKAERLKKFKEQYRKGVNSTPSYFTEENLETLVVQALFQWQQRQRTGAAPDAVHDEQVQRYRAEALAAHGTLHIAGFEKALRVPLDLAELYIWLRATIDLRGHGKAGFADARDAREQIGEEGDKRETSLMDAFNMATRLGRTGLVILGEPGSGKTTHLKRLLIGCLKEGSEKLGLPAGMLPVFLPLRDLEDPERETVDRFIERHLNEQLKLPRDFGARLLKRGNLLLLFDGLDEVAGADRREKVARWVERVLAAHSTCRTVVTCRFAGYGERGEREVRLSSEFLELHIQPLREDQPEEFVRQWYRLVETRLEPDQAVAARMAEERAADLIATLRRGDRRTTRMAEMVENPLLLASLCLVHRDHGRLPEDRWKLYQQCVEVLLERWRVRPDLSMKVEDAKRVLQPVAAWLHQEQGRVRARAADLEDVLAPELKAVRWERGAKELLATVRDDAGLLTGWGPDQFGFMHLSFQEYLTACELRRRASKAGETQAAVLAEVAGRYGESWWQEVLLLFVAMGNPSFFTPLMKEMVKRQAFAEHAELLGLLLQEASEKDPAPFVELLRQRPVPEARWWERWTGRTPGPDTGLWKRQRVALDALQQMGAKEELEALAGALGSHPSPDIRERVGGLQHAPDKPALALKGGVELVLIPGGEFWMGSPPEEEGRYSDETRHRVRVSPFWLGRYPVTNEQYGRFLKENPQVKSPAFWGDRRFNQSQQPVVGVTWEQAAQFSRWAGGRLPTEAEWEYACRAGTTGPRYDDDLDAIAWYAKNSGGATHPVGQKRENAWGLYDMLGNVWDWVEDWNGEYPENEELMTDPHGPKTGSARVTRGGGWQSNPPSSVRSAFRLRLGPRRSSRDVGFRCARGVDPP